MTKRKEGVCSGQCRTDASLSALACFLRAMHFFRHQKADISRSKASRELHVPRAALKGVAGICGTLILISHTRSSGRMMCTCERLGMCVRTVFWMVKGQTVDLTTLNPTCRSCLGVFLTVVTICGSLLLVHNIVMHSARAVSQEELYRVSAALSPNASVEVCLCQRSPLVTLDVMILHSVNSYLTSTHLVRSNCSCCILSHLQREEFPGASDMLMHTAT